MKLTRRQFSQGLMGSAATMGSSAFAGSALARDESRIIVDDGGMYRQEMNEAMRQMKAALDSASPVLSQQTLGYTRQAISQYIGIQQIGGWGVINADRPLQYGMNHRATTDLRRRLIISGDLDQRLGVSRRYDNYTLQAVRRFQLRHGLIPDGVAGNETLRALNVPVEQRILQLRTNLVRIGALSGDLGVRYVMVNIPGAELETVEAGRVAARHNAVVGKSDRQTPILSSRIIEVNFNPFWHAPKSIVRRDIIPKMREDPTYLSRFSIRIFDGRGNEIDPAMVNWNTDEAVSYLLRQDPGGLNSMGSIRINFPNSHSVYLHDTPLQSLFGENSRFHSSGCVRVQNVRDFVTWLLVPNGDWTRQRVDAVIESGERIDAAVKLQPPLYSTYITGWATESGIVHFRPDVYGWDQQGNMAIAGQDT